MRPRVKICGLTRPEDVALAAALGADALGFIFAPSKRRLSLEQARALTATVPVWINRVGVFGPDERESAAAIAEACGLDTLQFHGEPDLPTLAAHRGRFRVVQAIGVGDDGGTLGDRLNAIAAHVDAILLDTARPGQLGGTGETFDWAALASLAPKGHLRVPEGSEPLRVPLPGVPVLVAGGLNPHNVGDLLSLHRPWGLDVASGVEAEPGVKDPIKLKAFFEAVNGAIR